MATEPQPRLSFSPRRKWSIGFDVFARTLVVLAVVIMVNYLGGQYFQRFFLSSQTQIALSSRTVTVLQSVTNQVKVILYYDKEDPLYSTLLALLKEYRNVNPRIQIFTVDYQWDAAAAQKIKSTYKLGESSGDNEKNLVIFACEGRLPRIVSGSALADFTIEQVPNEKEREYRRRFTASNGEKMFTACLLAVTSPKPFRAYYLQGHGEHNLNSGDEVSGYMDFGLVLQHNYVQAEALRLVGTNQVPMDCNLLIIAGPTTQLDPVELDKIAQYLDQGGRLLALFNTAAKDRQTGLEKILKRWNVSVGESEVTDVPHSLKGNDIAVAAFSQHPVVRSLLGSMVYLIAPRPVANLPPKEGVADGPKVEVLAASEATAVLRGEPNSKPRRYPLAVAVEKGAPPGVVTERGSTRMIVVGDSFFLANGTIGLYANTDFARNAVNWLLDRPQLLEGIGQQPINEFRIAMTKAQLQTVRWILLAAMPGAMLLLGGLVWLRRRK
jgi:hypothetical protein